jgi:hypothetical protein
MNAKMLIAGVAIAALTAVSAQAASSPNAGAYAEPAQPIPYSSLKTYMKTPVGQRAKRDWSAGAAASAGNAGANASATMPTATQTPGANVADNPPTVSPQVSTAPTQPPLNQDSGMSNAQPPASNAPATTDQAGPTPQ